MKLRSFGFTAVGRTGVALLSAVVVAALWTPMVQGQTLSVRDTAVGGVLIDTAGILTSASIAERRQLAAEIDRQLAASSQELQGKTELRKVSLKRLSDILRQCRTSGQPIPAEVQFLAGLQQVRYVVACPEENDIVLIGPAEGWRVDKSGAVVGVTTGKAVLQLEDLLAALEAVSAPQPTVISCSIDPTEAGLQRLRSQGRSRLPSAQATAARTEQLLGPQAISLTGVDSDSRFARVMVAADYRMKRIGLAQEKAPIVGLPSYLEVARRPASMPRFWMAPEYETLRHDPDGLVWDIRGATVKTITENSRVAADGTVESTGQVDVASQRWADLMTAKYDELAMAEPVFAELRNCMDLSVVAALIVDRDLRGKASCDLSELMETAQGLPGYPAPTQVASKASLMKKSGGWTIACGGVEINPWTVVRNSTTDGDLASLRSQASLGDSQSWWAN